ncbi:MAG TPA: DUF4331 family protein, partial [Gemmatimonadaceae bacterium]|nr:DUF4331 family protein [Gemmatimonadaceae bacterium]
MNRNTWVAAAAVVVLAACADSPTSSTSTRNADALLNAAPANASFVQAERLGNPLVSEVMVVKRRHQLYNYAQPSHDPGGFSGDLVAFITGVAGRDQAYAEVVAGALLP